jgi:quercetin dioxygenase-like cupin family protein
MMIIKPWDPTLPWDENFSRAIIASSDQAAFFLYTFHPGQAMTSHTHPFSAEFLFILQGEATISVDTESVLAGPFTTIVVPPEAVHSITNNSSIPVRVASFMSPKP